MSNETKTEAMTAERLDLIRRRAEAVGWHQREGGSATSAPTTAERLAVEDVPALIAALKEAPEREAIRWQERLHALEGVREQDASGNESGDPLDYTADCVKKALDALNEELADMAADLDGAKRALAMSEESAEANLKLAQQREHERDEARGHLQTAVDRTVHYRNLAIGLGAKPEQMLCDQDRDLCAAGVSLTERVEGYAQMADFLDEAREHWARVDAAEKELDEMRAQSEARLRVGHRAWRMRGKAVAERDVLAARVVELEAKLANARATTLEDAARDVCYRCHDGLPVAYIEGLGWRHERTGGPRASCCAGAILDRLRDLALSPAAPPEQASTLQDPKP